jgi:D-sedoheptulose 7-phosphate isomerase
MTNPDRIRVELQAHTSVLQETVEACTPVILEIISMITSCFQNGRKLMLCGNGGSAADAQHVAAEFVNRFRFDRPALPAIALSTDSSILTAIGNDSAFDFVFSRQIEALAVQGDILVGISTSGRSRNVLKALEGARARGVMTIGFTSIPGLATMQPYCDLCLAIPSSETARIQEAHEFAWHVICGSVEAELFKSQEKTHNGKIAV